MLDIFLSTRDTSVNKTDIPALVEAYIPAREHNFSTYVKQLHYVICYKVMDAMEKKIHRPR